MEDLLEGLRQAYLVYRKELDEAERKHSPADGLLGFGHSIRDDACHERFDERVSHSVSELCAHSPAPEDAAQAVRLLLLRGPDADWQLSAQWMLRAAERHSLPLIDFLSREDAGILHKAYADLYRPWERLPVQKQVLKALKTRAGK